LYISLVVTLNLILLFEVKILREDARNDNSALKIAFELVPLL